MTAYRNAVITMSARFEGLEFHHIQRDSNQAADILARMGARRERCPKTPSLNDLFKPSVKWQGDTEPAKQAEEPSADLITPPTIEPDEEIVGGSAPEETSSAHEIMAVIAPWT